MTKTFLPTTLFLICSILTLSLLKSGKEGIEPIGKVKNLALHEFGNSEVKANFIIMQDNNPPKVNIVLPKANGDYKLDLPIPYKITVSDTEDGESKFDEIPSNEVLLEVKFVSAWTVSQETRKQEIDNYSGLRGIASSNCLFCHAFKGNLIAPSFYEISEHYNRINPEIGIITSRIRNGSTGIWGDNFMPSHPELTQEKIEAMVLWITKYASKKNVAYYHGLEGSIELHAEAQSDIQDGVFEITASYMDHGSEGKSKKIGQDQIVIHVEE